VGREGNEGAVYGGVRSATSYENHLINPATSNAGRSDAKACESQGRETRQGAKNGGGGARTLLQGKEGTATRSLSF